MTDVQPQTDTLDEIEILLDSLLKESRKTNEHLGFFHRLIIMGAVVYALVTVAAIVAVGIA
jgi:hypothetical protein